VQATDGNFYGTTRTGGAKCQSGTIFKITPTGVLTTLSSLLTGTYAKHCAGSHPSGLVQAANGNFYGTMGGFLEPGGSVFKMTPSGTLTVLYSFCSQSGCPDGSGPVGPLVQATDGYFYGMTVQGGVSAYCTISVGCGTVFKVTASGKLTTLYSFCSQSGCTDGEEPLAGLIQDTDGNLYGTTVFGGAPPRRTAFTAAEQSSASP
jgi:uncharacterized repeat protein (TIGR03803 family)